MRYAYTINEGCNLVVVRFRGGIDFFSEMEAVISIFKDQRVKPDVRVIIERTQAAIEANPGKMGLFFEIITQSIEGLGRPMIAVVVADAIEFNMMQLMKLQSHIQLNYDYEVFMNINDALAWFEIETRDIWIPEF